MKISLPGALCLLIHMQEYLCHVKGNMVTLTKGVHQALEGLRWLSQDLERCPTRLYKLVPIHTTLDG